MHEKENLAGFAPERMARLIQEAVDRTELDLNDLTVLTEAATGAYAVTPVIAACAGAARVLAFTRPTRYGKVEEVCRETNVLSGILGVSDRISIVEDNVQNLEPVKCIMRH